jgi:glycerol-3-phosphate O-acyltransferase
MSGRLGPVMGPLARVLLDPIPYPEEAAEKIRALAERGIVVYVHRSRNAVDYLALSRASQRLGLPQARFVGGLDVRLWQPWWRVLGRGRSLRGAPQDPALREEWLLRRCVSAGDAAELFLRRPLTLMTTRADYRARYVQTLVTLQRELDRPIFLVPHLLALRRRLSSFEPTASDVVFGTGEEPGALRAFTRLALSLGHARWEVSDPIDLQAFVEDNADQSDAVLAKKVRWALLNHLVRVERSVHGPPMKSHGRMQDETLRDLALRRVMEELSEQDKQPVALFEQRAKKLYDEIAARFDIDFVRLGDKVLKLVWSRIYDGLEVDQEGIERVRRASREGPLIIVPSHRSHVDYLVMSQALFWNGLMPPLIAAGANLSFFPLGALFRRGGAYFLRRSFKGDPLYSQTFRAYVKRLFKEGFSQEFFIEGGRSRTGKTLPPKLGMLSMLVDAFLEARQPDAMFVPASISYERIIEAASYTRELGGAEKEKEGAGALLRTAGVLRSRYGRVFVSIDDPLSLTAFMKEQGFDRDEHTEEQKRRLVRVLAHRIAWGINRAQVVTANALVITALFGYRKRGLRRSWIREAVRIMVAHVLEVSESRAMFPEGLMEHLDARLSAALDRLVADGFVHCEEAAGEAFYRVDDDAYLKLDFYKNSILHHFVPEAILATATRALGAKPGARLQRDALKDRAQRLSQVFKLEFIYRVGGGFSAQFEDVLQRTVERGFLIDEGALICVPNETERAKLGLSFTANLIASFVETYRSVLFHLEHALPSDSQKALVLRLLDLVRAEYLSGELRCAEAVNKVVVEQAVRLLFELGLLHSDESGAPGLVASRDEERRGLLALLEASRLPPPE